MHPSSPTTKEAVMLTHTEWILVTILLVGLAAPFALFVYEMILHKPSDG